MTSVLTREELSTVVAAATRAPSILNSQPWRFRAHADVIDLWADPDRGLVHLDPQGRELLISCGAALLNLRLALADLGRAANVRLLPDAGNPTWVARVHVVGRQRTTAAEHRLAAAIPVRRASRDPFDDADVAEGDLARLLDAARTEGGRLERPPSWHRATLTGLVRDAGRRQRDDAGTVADVTAWTGDRAPAGAGVRPEEYGPRPSDPAALVRDFAVGRHHAGRISGSFDVEGLMLVLLTDHDAAPDRVRAGQALERVWLEATASGLALTLLTQPTEVRDLRPWMRDPCSPWAAPQALLMLGHAPLPPVTDRRPVHEVLVVD